MKYTILSETPVGPLTIAADDVGLRYLLFSTDSTVENSELVKPDWERCDRSLRDVVTQLRAYLRGSLKQFGIPLAPEGTEFQQRVWAALRDVPYGETRTYGEIAAAIGQPTASRAVGMANGRNPVSIVIPCHRIIGSSGRLVGYGGGLDRKSTLLRLERSIP
ncbi:MAG: methylated-DNA--[protein]-cysteine S-methyltransferase [Planctomyces sp.]|jgi:methylated-DNA-[protein]-cysteine S-methyltransferase